MPEPVALSVRRQALNGAACLLQISGLIDCSADDGDMDCGKVNNSEVKSRKHYCERDGRAEQTILSTVLPILDALACGCAVVTVDSPALDSILVRHMKDFSRDTHGIPIFRQSGRTTEFYTAFLNDSMYVLHTSNWSTGVRAQGQSGLHSLSAALKAAILDSTGQTRKPALSAWTKKMFLGWFPLTQTLWSLILNLM